MMILSLNAPKPQSFDFNEPIVSNPLDPQLQQELVYKIFVAKHHSLAITPTPLKSTSTHNIIPHFDPSFFKLTKEFENFFLHPNTPLTIKNFEEQQKLDPVLSIVYD